MKIGIFTHYYLSNNYGGNLQAYALCRVLRDLGFDATQICYKRDLYSKTNCFKKLYRKTKHYLKAIIMSMISHRFYSSIRKRKRAIYKFNQNVIPHSNRVYDDSNLESLNKMYDCFITGSDQVWHPNVFCSGYLLEFCNTPSKKISYAASIATSTLDKMAANRLKEALSSFSHISIRERDSITLLSELGIQNCEWVLDPTLLLDADDWRKVSKPLDTPKEYVLTYFLGDNAVSRQRAKEYAKKNNLLLVSLPYLLNSYRECDDNYGDLQLYSVSPEQLIYLIDHSNIVFTDSFHATVFSIILSTNFFVFKRNASDNMTNRIESLLGLFNLSDRFINNEQQNLINSKPNLKDISFEKYELMKKRSIDFLYSSLHEIR